MTFRQNGQYNGIFGKTVPFLTLRDDVIEGSPHPKLNGYQQGTPGGACSAKGLGTFAQRAGGCTLGWGVATVVLKNKLTESPA